MFNFEELDALAVLCEGKIRQLQKDEFDDKFEEAAKPWIELLIRVKEERDELIPLLHKDF